MSLAYYNEHDSYAAHWLRNLIAAGHIAPGVVDERDIRDVRPKELIGFTQVHMFAGIGVWSHALRSAGWADDRPIWTGSCPCQPFSAAGRAGGFADERHLWPHWHWLIEQCRPAVVLGEQVASKDGLGWFDLVSADLEGSGYAVGASDLCAAGIGVDWQASQSGEWLRRAILDCVDPVVRSMLCDFADWVGAGNISEGGNHIRQRLYFVGLADSAHSGRGRIDGQLGETQSDGIRQIPWQGDRRVERRSGSDLERLADSMHAGRSERGTGAGSGQTAGLRAAGGLADDSSKRLDGRHDTAKPDGRFGVKASRTDGGANAADGRRYAKDWLFCRDDRWRAVEPRTFPLANGVAARVGKLRAFGNALDAETATRFCEVVKEICDG